MPACEYCNGTGHDNSQGIVVRDCAACHGTGWKKSKAERQAATAAQTKCACGNVCAQGMTRCGACQARHEAVDDLVDGLRNSYTVEDLKHWIEADLLPLLSRGV